MLLLAIPAYIIYRLFNVVQDNGAHVMPAVSLIFIKAFSWYAAPFFHMYNILDNSFFISINTGVFLVVNTRLGLVCEKIPCSN